MSEKATQGNSQKKDSIFDYRGNDCYIDWGSVNFTGAFVDGKTKSIIYDKSGLAEKRHLV